LPLPDGADPYGRAGGGDVIAAINEYALVIG
jgi:hypothetical protein